VTRGAIDLRRLAVYLLLETGVGRLWGLLLSEFKPRIQYKDSKDEEGDRWPRFAMGNRRPYQGKFLAPERRLAYQTAVKKELRLWV